MGTSLYNQYNKQKNIVIEIKLNKTCYFPEDFISGEIVVVPKNDILNKLIQNPELTINIILYQLYIEVEVETSGDETTTNRIPIKEIRNIFQTTLNFSNYIGHVSAQPFTVPFSVQIPKNVYPSVLIDKETFAIHFFSVEFPHIDAKRTKMFIIKNTFPNNREGNLLVNNCNMDFNYNKKSLFAKKGSYTINVKLPKNYFYYDEKVPFEITIDCSKLDLSIKYLVVSIYRALKKNRPGNHFQEYESKKGSIIKKKIPLEKLKGTNHHVSDFITFPNGPKDIANYPPNVYKELDNHGIFEVNDSVKYKLYPSAYYGLVSVDYFLKIKVHFRLLTGDERILFPIFFCEKDPKYDNNFNQPGIIPNQNDMLYNQNNTNPFTPK